MRRRNVSFFHLCFLSLIAFIGILGFEEVMGLQVNRWQREPMAGLSCQSSFLILGLQLTSSIPYTLEDLCVKCQGHRMWTKRWIVKSIPLFLISNPSLRLSQFIPSPHHSLNSLLHLGGECVDGKDIVKEITLNYRLERHRNSSLLHMSFTDSGHCRYTLLQH